MNVLGLCCQLTVITGLGYIGNGNYIEKLTPTVILCMALYYHILDDITYDIQSQRLDVCQAFLQHNSVGTGIHCLIMTRIGQWPGLMDQAEGKANQQHPQLRSLPCSENWVLADYSCSIMHIMQ